MKDFLILYGRERKGEFLRFFLFSLIFLCSFALYHLPPAAVLYPALICLLIGVIFLIADLRRAFGRHRRLSRLEKLPAALMEDFPEAQGPAEADCLRIIGALCKQQKELQSNMEQRYTEMVDYYTIWAHQIKTPIASMRLNLQNEDSVLSRTVQEDLFRIEQYVEMVLTYLRLDGGSSDYVIKEYNLDEIVRQAVRHFAGQFISRKIRLVYEPVAGRVVTDEKWLLFVIEQILSNALKYTPVGGCITVRLEEPSILCISDTGIGIAPEDLPRIFEKGYTGYNGRSDKKASGIGLYLCRRICANLGHRIAVNSSPESGTAVRMDLGR